MISATVSSLMTINLDLRRDTRLNAKDFILQKKIQPSDIISAINYLPQKPRLALLATFDLLIEDHPEFLQHDVTLFLIFCKKQTHETAKRCVTRMMYHLLKKIREHFSLQDINTIIELNFDWLISNSLVATRVNCISNLFLLRNENDWLLPELQGIIEQQIPESTISLKSRGEKILQKIQREKNKKSR